MNLVEKIINDVMLDKASQKNSKITKPSTKNKEKSKEPEIVDDEIETEVDLNPEELDNEENLSTDDNDDNLDVNDPYTNDELATSDTDEVNSSKKNIKSHKPKSKSYGVSKEAVEFLKKQGLEGLNAYPQSFVTLDQITINPEIKKRGKDSVWVAKFPFKLPNGNDAVKTAYTRGFMKKSQVAKYKKISKITSKDIQDLESKTDKLISSDIPAIADSGCIIKIILKTGLRIGSEDNSNTGNLGVRTLKVGNVSISGDKINLNFIGKSYQENVATIKDKTIASYLKRNMKGKSPNDNLFSASYERVGATMKKINPKGINPKDLRTYKATEVAKNLLQDKTLGMPPPIPKGGKDLKKLVKDKLQNVFTKVAEVLNNTPAMAKNSYVHPVVITDWLNSLNLVPQEVGYKHITMEAKQANTIIFTTMDEMFMKYANYGEGVDTSDISEEDMYNCEEYPLDEWIFDPNVQLVKQK